MKWLFATCLVAFLLSCHTEPIPASVDYEKIRPKSPDEKKTNQLTKDSTTVDLSCFNRDSVDLGIEVAHVNDTAYFLDRFTTKLEIQHLTLKTNHAEYIFGAWRFRDSIARKNAVFNWLDRFGEHEISINWLKSINLGKSHILILFNERSVVALTGTSKPSVTKWINYQRVNFPKDSVRYVLTGMPNKKCQWYRALSPKNLVLCRP